MQTGGVSGDPGNAEKPLKDNSQCGSPRLAVDTTNPGEDADP
jgi:hypothetical protein